MLDVHHIIQCLNPIPSNLEVNEIGWIHFNLKTKMYDAVSYFHTLRRTNVLRKQNLMAKSATRYHLCVSSIVPQLIRFSTPYSPGLTINSKHLLIA